MCKPKNFHPVHVTGGRKFRGFGYVIGYIPGGKYQISLSYSVPTDNRAKIWDPVNKKIEIVTERYVHELNDTKTNELGDTYQTHYMEYVQHLINDTLSWCKTKVATEAEAIKFARACLIKHHRDMIDEIDRLLPDQRDVVEEIEKALDYAIRWRNFKTGKPATPKKTVQLAIDRIIRNGVHKLEGFADAWTMLTNLRSLPTDKFPIPSEHIKTIK